MLPARPGRLPGGHTVRPPAGDGRDRGGRARGRQARPRREGAAMTTEQEIIMAKLSYEQIVAANQQSAALLLFREAMVTAVADRRLDRTHIRVLSAIGLFIDRSTEAWPSRETIRLVLGGLSLKTVSNVISDLKDKGYLVTTRKPIEKAGGKVLTVYTFGNIDHDTIRRVHGHFITSHVRSYQEAYTSEMSIAAA